MTQSAPEGTVWKEHNKLKHVEKKGQKSSWGGEGEGVMVTQMSEKLGSSTKTDKIGMRTKD